MIFKIIFFFFSGWRRAWYFIQQGKLFTLSKFHEINPKLVCDLIVSRVQLSTSKDARYTFEVRTASERNAIVFQAMDQKDCLRWIDAITYGVEQSISSQSAVAAALSNHDQEKETLAMTPETFLLQATQKKNIGH